MSRSLSLALLFLATACSSPPPEENVVSSSEEELVTCGWLAGGSCQALPAGDWRSPYFWADFTLAKFAHQRRNAIEHIEPGPTPLAKPRTVLLITGVTIKAEWFDGIVAR